MTDYNHNTNVPHYENYVRELNETFRMNSSLLLSFCGETAAKRDIYGEENLVVRLIWQDIDTGIYYELAKFDSEVNEENYEFHQLNVVELLSDGQKTVTSHVFDNYANSLSTVYVQRTIEDELNQVLAENRPKHALPNIVVHSNMEEIINSLIDVVSNELDRRMNPA